MSSWLRDHAAGDDGGVTHVVTVSGQDYPVRPLADLHRALLASGDGLVEHFPVLAQGSHWPLREGRARRPGCAGCTSSTVSSRGGGSTSPTTR